MTDHPITPPPELMQQWAVEFWGHPKRLLGENEKHIATQAARWGADQELEACLEWHRNRGYSKFISLREDRRPKPPSLKEQALAELEILSDYAHGLGCSESAIRRALEALPE